MIAANPTRSLYPERTRRAHQALTSQFAPDSELCVRRLLPAGRASLCLALRIFPPSVLIFQSLAPFTPLAVSSERSLEASPVEARSVNLLPARHSARVRININPWHLRFLCFHTLTHSSALSKTLSPIVSCLSALFAQNTRGGYPLLLTAPRSAHILPMRGLP